MKRSGALSEKILSGLSSLRAALTGAEGIYYINGPETLPPPLEGDEEAAIMERIEQGDKGAREPLITHNLRLVVYIAKKFESPNKSKNTVLSAKMSCISGWQVF